ncbi:MAG: response regulator [Holosporales bacterium]|jgi:two-component system phosphate regulon response regulator OmpR|nr:response regulator [Holosporales bacterium]
MAQQVTCLIVDDDAQLRALLQEFLNRHGYAVELAEDVLTAHALLKRQTFDAIILDIMLPGKGGVEWTRELKMQGTLTPILLLTARALPGDRISGLEAGADDYLSKPFEPQELLLRLRNLVRKHRKTPQYLILGERRVDLHRGTITREGEETLLSSTELNLLRTLVSRLGEPLSREELNQLSEGHISERSVDVQITRLRQKIESDPSRPRFLQTVRHRGYVLWADEEVK